MVIERLLDSQIHSSWDELQLIHTALSKRMVRRQFPPDDLNIDGRRNPKIQDLADNIDGHGIEQLTVTYGSKPLLSTRCHHVPET